MYAVKTLGKLHVKHPLVQHTGTDNFCIAVVHNLSAMYDCRHDISDTALCVQGLNVL